MIAATRSVRPASARSSRSFQAAVGKPGAPGGPFRAAPCQPRSSPGPGSCVGALCVAAARARSPWRRHLPTVPGAKRRTPATGSNMAPAGCRNLPCAGRGVAAGRAARRMRGARGGEVRHAGCRAPRQAAAGDHGPARSRSPARARRTPAASASAIASARQATIAYRLDNMNSEAAATCPAEMSG